MLELVSYATKAALKLARDGDGQAHEHLARRMKDLDALRRRRGLESCVISKAEYDAISQYMDEYNAAP